MRRSAARTAAYVTVLTPRLTATPASADPVIPVPAAMMTPASAGPTTRAALKDIEFRAIALWSRCRGTRSAARAWRIGMSTALTNPSTSAITITIQISTAPVATITKSTKRLQAGGGLGGDQGMALVDPIRDDAAERRQEQGRAELEDGHEPELQRSPTQGQDEPRQAHLLHPGADQADDLSPPVEPIVPDRERGEPALQAAEGGAQRYGSGLVGQEFRSPRGCSC